MPETKRPIRVFLCHASQDKPAVRELYQRLKKEGWIDPWLDEERLTLGQHWTSVIEEALDVADVVVIFLSHNSVQKEGFVQRELNYAWDISLEKPRNVIFLIPFRLDDCEVPRHLRSRQWGDYFGEEKEYTYQILLRSLKERREQKLRLENSERESAKKAKLEKLKREASEKARNEVVEKVKRERAEHEATEKSKREAAERDERERIEREAGEKAAREEAEREAAAKLAREKIEKEYQRQREKIIRDGRRKKLLLNIRYKLTSIRLYALPILFGISAIALLIYVFYYMPSNFPVLGSTPTSNLTLAPQLSITATKSVVASETFAPVSTPTKKLTSTATSLPTEITDAKGVSMMLVPAGKFTMGNDNSDADERPAHQVYLVSYYIDKYEVTNSRYKACVDAGICTPPQTKDSDFWVLRRVYYGNSQYDNYPVFYVDWSMSKSYCEWRGGSLPTEAQWEKAARGTDGRIYPWGNDFEKYDCDKASYYGCVGSPSEVGNYKDGKSPYGIYDLAGNVSEWVSDWYSVSYYQNSSDNNPAGPESGEYRVVRGGAWTSRVNSELQTFNRIGNNPRYFSYGIGFRCVMDASP